MFRVNASRNQYTGYVPFLQDSEGGTRTCFRRIFPHPNHLMPEKRKTFRNFRDEGRDAADFSVHSTDQNALSRKISA